MKSIKILYLSLLFSVLIFTGCASKPQLSDAGKSGTIDVSIGSHLTVQAIDGLPTKLKSSMRLEPGEHVIDIHYYKFTLDYTLEGYATRTFYFEEGKSYTLEAETDMNSNACFYVFRENGLQKFTDSKTSVKPIEDPETSNGKNIQIVNKLPLDRPYEITGIYEYTLSAGVFGTKSLTEDRALLYLLEFLYQNDVDAITELWVANTFSGVTASAMGIRYLD